MKLEPETEKLKETHKGTGKQMSANWYKATDNMIKDLKEKGLWDKIETLGDGRIKIK